MLDTCSRPPQSQTAVVALTVSAVIWAAWASVSSQRSLAAAGHSSAFTAKLTSAHMPTAVGLHAWVRQHKWTKPPNRSKADGGPRGSRHAAMVNHGSLHDSSVQLPVTLADAPTQSTAAAATSETPSPGADALADALAPLTASSVAVTAAPATHAFAAGPNPLAAASVSAPRLGASARTPDPASVPAPGPADSAQVPAPRPDVTDRRLSTADPRWLTGAARDLRACLRDDRDGVPATIEGVIAGALPR
jgi:hypothetical protein